MKNARTIHFLTWFFLSLLLCLSTSLANDDETTPISGLDVQPTTIDIPRFDSHARAPAIIIARVAGSAAVPAELALSAIATPGLEVRTGDRSVNAGDITWPVSIRAIGDGPDDGVVDFRLSYSAAKGNRPGTPPILVRRAQLKVRMEPGRETSPVDDAELSIRPDAIALTEHLPIKADLMIKNKSNYPFEMSPIDIDHPDFLKVDGGQAELTVGAHETLRVPLAIKVIKAPQTSDWLIGASVPLKRGSGETERRGTAVVQQTVKVDMAGASDVVKVLNLPSLLIVPGALILGAWSLLLGPRDRTTAKWLDWRSSNFWIVSITLSILIFGILGASHTGPDPLVPFSVPDVAILWLSCVGGAGAAFFAYHWGKHRLAWRAETERRQHEPVAGDEPVFILDKLDRANMPFYLQSYRHEVGGLEQKIFELGFSAPENMAWVVPQMLLQQIRSDQAADRQVRLIIEANGRPGDGRAALVAMLKQALQQQQITLKWQTGLLAGPQTVALDRLGAAGGLESPISTG